MNLDKFSKWVTEELPFDEHILVFIVMGKILAICNILEFKFWNLKYDPEKSVELREYYLEINTDYHINEKNSLNFYGNLNDNQIK